MTAITSFLVDVSPLTSPNQVNSDKENYGYWALSDNSEWEAVPYTFARKCVQVGFGKVRKIGGDFYITFE